MPKQTEIRFNLQGLEELRDQVGGTFITRVGILGAKNARSGVEGMSNSEIGVVHEFGSESRNIPPRSFLRFPIEQKAHDLVKGMTTTSVRNAVERRQYRKVFQILGVIAEGIVQNAFSTGGFGSWQKLKQSTINAKGSSAILIDTGELRRSITSDVVKKGEI